jgi:hypothetical protein
VALLAVRRNPNPAAMHNSDAFVRCGNSSHALQICWLHPIVSIEEDNPLGLRSRESRIASYGFAAVVLMKCANPSIAGRK